MTFAIRTTLALALAAFFSVTTLASDLPTASKPMTIAEVHAARADLEGKTVTVKGKVVKVNNGILNRNFIHVTDGTGEGDTAKLVFTSQQSASIGDEIVATGKVVLDTDFGMGYFYATIVEESTIMPASHGAE